MHTEKSLTQELKELLIETLSLEDVGVEDIDDEQPLIYIGAGLDSIDILELVMVLRRDYGVEFGDDADEIREHFSSIQTLASFVQANRES